jgi:hypothetical protein
MLKDNDSIKIALDFVKNHPSHHLEIGIRRSVWLLTGEVIKGEGIKNKSRKRRFILSRMCAEYTKSVHSEYYHDNIDMLNLYQKGISISSAYWDDEITLKEMSLFTNMFYPTFESSGNTSKIDCKPNEHKLYHRKAFFAMASVWECLRVSFNDNPFNEQLEINVKDSDVDYYDYDAAYCAAIAHAGSEWDLKNSDREKRLIFWKWWLEEAVPQVLKL